MLVTNLVLILFLSTTLALLKVSVQEICTGDPAQEIWKSVKVGNRLWKWKAKLVRNP